MSAFSYLFGRPLFDQADDIFFARALKLAQAALGIAHPNPAVGAVVVKDGRIVAEGHTQVCGGMHAEKQALSRARESVEGATLYVTLEPCSHFGRTPPCTDAIIEAGIRRVISGAVDPNPVVCGKGLSRLSEAGIEVILCKNPLLNKMAEEQIAPFKKWILEKRPYVIAKVATSKDNKIALEGKRTKISCDESDRVVHMLRHAIDAVMVGANTVRVDNPQLTARLEQATRQPARIVVSSDLNLPDDLAIFDTSIADTIIMTTASCHPRARPEDDNKRGVRVVECRMQDNRVDLRDAMSGLAKLGFTSVLAETGREMFSTLMEQGLLDEIWWFHSPVDMGVLGLDLGYSADDLWRKSFQAYKTHRLGADELTIFRFIGGRREIPVDKYVK